MLDARAKDNTTLNMSNPASTNSHGLKAPVFAAATAGNPNIPAPITPLSVIAL
jgi:hypothetical protein